jgi:hypothetical protein
MRREDKIKMLARTEEGRRALLRAAIMHHEAKERKKKLAALPWYKRWWAKLTGK